MQTSYSIMPCEILKQLLMNNDTLLSSIQIFMDPRLRKLLSLEKINTAKMYLRRFCNRLYTTTDPSQSQERKSKCLASTSTQQNIQHKKKTSHLTHNSIHTDKSYSSNNVGDHCMQV